MAEKGYLLAIEEALGYSPQMMSSAMGLSLREYMTVRRTMATNLGEFGHDEMWSGLAEHVDMQIGALTALRRTLRDKATKELARRLSRRARIVQ